ncbi:hypothetical protein [Pseudomonas sp. SDO52101_S400]
MADFIASYPGVDSVHPEEQSADLESTRDGSGRVDFLRILYGGRLCSHRYWPRFFDRT